MQFFGRAIVSAAIWAIASGAAFAQQPPSVHCITSKDAGKSLAEPRPTVETPQNLVTSATDADMNKAMDNASWAMIELLQKVRSLSRLDAYALASMTMDCRVGEMDAADKSVHCLVAKSMWTKR